MDIKKSEAREILKDFLPDYLGMEGISLTKGNACPCCNDSQRKKKAFRYNKKTNTVHCFSCGFDGDIFELVKEQYGLKDFNEALEKTASLLGYTLVNDYGKDMKTEVSDKEKIRPKFIPKTEPEAPEVDYLDYIKRCAKQNNFKYLESRGISRDVQKKFLVGYDPSWKNPVVIERWKKEGKDIKKIPASPRCIIPNSRFSYLARDVRENLSEHEKGFSKQVAGKKRLFNHKAFEKAGVFFIVEGEIDALSCEEVGFTGVGLCGAANVQKVIDLLKKDSEGKKVVIMLDPDQAGKKNARKLCEGLDEIGVFYVNAFDFPLNIEKDPNEMLCSNREGFIEKLTWLEEAAQLGKVPTYVDLMKAGAGVEEIAERRGVKASTVETKALSLYERGEIDNIDFIIDDAFVEVILAEAAKPTWTGRLSEIKENIPEECSFNCIRAVLAKYKVKESLEQAKRLDLKIENAECKCVEQNMPEKSVEQAR